MKIHIITEEGKKIDIDVDENDMILDIKSKYRFNYKFIPGKGFSKSWIKLYYNNKELLDYETIKSCSLKEDSIIEIKPCDPPAPDDCIYSYSYDAAPKFPLRLTKRLTSQCTTHISNICCKIKNLCYAIVAAGSYKKIIEKIYEPKQRIPGFDACFHIAKYSDNDGNALTSLRILEDRFHFGIQYKEEKNLSIKDAILSAPIVCFTTSSKGWQNIKKGSLLINPGGLDVSQYYAFVDGYDLEKNCYICTSSFGELDEDPIHFDFVKEAANSFSFIVPYFYTGLKMNEYEEQQKQKEKTCEILESLDQNRMPVIKKFIYNVNGHEYHCAWMNDTTAYFNLEYLVEYHPEKTFPFNKLGYNALEWIESKLNS